VWQRLLKTQKTEENKLKKEDSQDKVLKINILEKIFILKKINNYLFCNNKSLLGLSSF
jgi:hypothetical protein